MLNVVNEDGTTEAGSLIDEIVREGLSGCWPPPWRRKWTST